MIKTFLAVMALTTFISVDGQLKEVPIGSQEAEEYFENVDIDIGDMVLDEIHDTEHTTDESALTDTVSGSDLAPDSTLDNPQVLALLEESLELLAENSSSVTGTLNTSVLGLMDRMINEYPSYYKYAGFRTSDDDAYSSILYIAKNATVNGKTIIFSDDCIAVTFSRQTQNYATSYIYYEVTKSPNASVNISNRSIVYTNVIDGYPSLGTLNQRSDDWLWIIVFTILASAIFIRRKKHD